MSATILIVDDEEMVRQQIGTSLEFGGFRTAQAANGDEATDWLKSNQADVMITDILMPTKEGIETIREVRKTYPDVRIIAISGRMRTDKFDLLALAQQFGADQILPKPFGRDQLLKAVHHLLDSPRLS